jgi:hypothetical protein
MKRYASFVPAAAAALLLTGCLGGSFDLGSTAPAPTDVRAYAGDSSVTLTWTNGTNVEYWVFGAPGTTISTQNWDSLGGFAYPKVTSPHMLSGLTNGTTYAFTINGRVDGGPGGPGSTVVTATPRLAGANWILGSALGNTNLNDVAWDGQQFIAVGNDGALYAAKDFNPAAPIAWTALTHPQAAPRAHLYTTVYGGLHLAAGAGGVILRSTDAKTWTVQEGNSGGNDLYGLATNGVGGYVAVGQNGTIVSSVDGQNWTRQSSGTNQHLYAVVHGQGLWVAVGQNGTLLTSNNGMTWTAQASGSTQTLRDVTYGPLVDATTSASTAAFIAVGESGTQITSRDAGAHWTASIIDSGTTTLRAIICSRQCVITGNGGALYTGTDGISWARQTSNTSQTLNSVAYSNANLAVLGEAGSNLSAY